MDTSDVDEDVPASMAWQILRIFVAALLIVAACAKLMNVVPILEGNGLLSRRPLLLAAIGFEAGLATYLLVGDTVWSWRATIATFATFALAAIYAIASGKSCNCISQSISPGFMLLLDIAVLALAFRFRPALSARSRIMGFRVSLLLSAVAGIGFVGFAATADQSTDRTDPLEFLLADMMIGKAWPLNSQFHPGLQPVESGNWLVLVVRHDCDHCRGLLDDYFADPLRHRDGERTAVFVAGTDTWPFQLDRVSFDAEPGHEIRWPSGEPFVASPGVFVLDAGTITDARDGSESEEFMRALFNAESDHSPVTLRSSIPGSEPHVRSSAH